MCRFLAYLSRESVTPVELLANGALHEFIALSRENRDGWGLAWCDEDDSLRLAKAPEPAQGSADFYWLTSTVRTDSLVLHLRWATRGLGFGLEDTHPFSRDGIAFAHNGAIKPVERLEELVPAEERGTLDGTTDSERYFLAAVSALEQSRDEEEALRGLLRDIDGRCRYTSLNCLLLTPDRLYAVCRYDPKHSDARYHLRRDPDYFKLRYRDSPESLVVASSGWRASGRWETLENGQALVVERRILEKKLLEIA
jgi:predicted glutamine amidotransferase